MRQSLPKHLGLWLVFGAGAAAAVYGVFLFLTFDEPEFASAWAACGFALLAWVIRHPARPPEPLG